MSISDFITALRDLHASIALIVAAIIFIFISLAGGSIKGVIEVPAINGLQRVTIGMFGVLFLLGGLILSVVPTNPGSTLISVVGSPSPSSTAMSSPFIPTSTIGDQKLFSDHFENGNSNNWVPFAGLWSVCQVSGSSKEYCGSSGHEDISLAGNPSWTNYYVQSYVFIGTREHDGISLLGRVQDGSHFYQAELTNNGRSWYIWKNNGGTWKMIARGSFDWSASSYYLLKFDLNGSILTLSVSTNQGSIWQVLGSGLDTTWPSGKIGLRIWGAIGRFDQIEVISD
jgi:hypothetical protein